MGKGFRCSKAVTGLDLNELITDACQRAVGALRAFRDTNTDIVAGPQHLSGCHCQRFIGSSLVSCLR